MKTISTDLDTHLQQDVTTVARCWKIVRQDTTGFFFTSLDEDLVIDGDTYTSLSGFSNSAIQSNSDLSVDNLDVGGVFDDASITIEDLRAGLFDYADFYLFIVNWSDLTQGKLKLRRGKLGEVVSSPQGWFQTELRGMTQLLQQNTIELFGPECRADLFDPRCGLSADAFKSQATVTSVTDSTHFIVTLTTSTGTTTDNTWFQYGNLKFTAGDNDGRAMEIKSWNHSTGTLELYISEGYPVQIGDTLDLWPGCDKSFATCKSKFSNRLNFRGEPYLPGNDQVFFYPNAQG